MERIKESRKNREMHYPVVWRFHFVGDEESFDNLTWPEAKRVCKHAEDGELIATGGGMQIYLEFNTSHVVLDLKLPDNVWLRPYFPHRPGVDQDLAPFFRAYCGTWIHDRDEYLARGMEREEGFRLFVAVLVGPSLPSRVPERYCHQPLLPELVDYAPVLADYHAVQWLTVPTRTGRG